MSWQSMRHARHTSIEADLDLLDQVNESTAHGQMYRMFLADLQE